MPYGYVTDKTKIIKRIFQDHWEEFLSQHKDKIPEEMQSSVIDAVNKMLICGTKEIGYAVCAQIVPSILRGSSSSLVKAVSAPPVAKYMLMGEEDDNRNTG